MKKNIKYLICLVVPLLLINTACAYESAHDVEVLYWHEEKGGKHYYYYNIVNNSNEVDVVNVQVGYKYDYEGGEPQLFAPRADTSHIPLEFISPNGWVGEVEYLEESLNYSLNWTTTGEQYDVKKGKSSFKFGVVLSNQRNDHINTFFTVIFGDSTISTEQMVASTKAPKNVILAPIYQLLLSKGIQPNVIGISKNG